LSSTKGGTRFGTERGGKKRAFVEGGGRHQKPDYGDGRLDSPSPKANMKKVALRGVWEKGREEREGYRSATGSQGKKSGRKERCSPGRDEKKKAAGRLSF